MKLTFSWGTLKALHAKSKLEKADKTDRWPELTAKMKELVEQQFTNARRDVLAYELERYGSKLSLLDWADCWHRALSRSNMEVRERKLTQRAEESLQDLKHKMPVDAKIQSSSVSVVNVTKAVQISVTLSFEDEAGECALARFIWMRGWEGSSRGTMLPTDTFQA